MHHNDITMQNRTRSASPSSHATKNGAVFAVPNDLKGMLSVFFFVTLIAFASSLAFASQAIFLFFVISLGCFIYFYVRVDQTASALARSLSAGVDLSHLVMDTHVRSKLSQMGIHH